MELQNIRENRQAAKRKKIKLTPLEQEIEADQESWFERSNIHFRKMLEKANKEKNMLRHMAYHYLVRNKVCKARIRTLKAMLRRDLRKRKEQDKPKILAEDSLAQHSTWFGTLSPNFKKFGTRFAILEFLARKQVFLPDASCHLALAFDGDLLLRKTQTFSIFHGKICMLTNGQEILTGFELPKRSKTPQKWPFCPFFDT